MDQVTMQCDCWNEKTLPMKHGKLKSDQTSLLFMTASPYAAASYHTRAIYSPYLPIYMHHYSNTSDPHISPLNFLHPHLPTFLFHIHPLRLGFCHT